MEPILTRCGYRCDLCLAYRPNVEASPQNRQVLSAGWEKYFGFRLRPEVICCDGCMSSGASLVDQNCPVRPCVIEKGLHTCAQCGEYICPRLAERVVVFEEMQARRAEPIPAQDRQRFILPYENRPRLDALRPGLPQATLTVQELLERIRAGYARFNAILERIPPADMLKPGVTGDWSVKDLLVHIAVHQQRMLEWLTLTRQGKTPAGPQPYAMPEEPLADLNACIHRGNQGRALDDAIHEFDQTHACVLDFISNTTGDFLFNPARHCLRDGEPLWVAVAANTYEHLDEHGREIQEAFS